MLIPDPGCTPGFWQGGTGSQLWNDPNDPDWTASGGQGTNPFIHTTLFNNFFTPYAPAAGLTMFDLVSSGGGSEDWRKAARDVVAAYLNASWGMAFPYTPAEIATLWTGAVSSGNFAQLHNLLAPANDPSAIGGFCPISGSF